MEILLFYGWIIFFGIIYLVFLLASILAKTYIITALLVLFPAAIFLGSRKQKDDSGAAYLEKRHQLNHDVYLTVWEVFMLGLLPGWHSRSDLPDSFLENRESQCSPHTRG